MEIEKIELDELTQDAEIYVYTDGACKGNPGPGGWAFAVLVDGYGDRKLLHESTGSVKHTTSNCMELQAAIEALTYLKENHLFNITIVTDSEYVFNGATEWIQKWKMKGWKTSSREPVKNKPLWLQIDALNATIGKMSKITWCWSKGHSKNLWNDYVDHLASDAALEAKAGRI